MSSSEHVEVRIDAGAPAELTAEHLRDLTSFTLRHEGVDGPAGVGLVVTDDATIQELHARHMGIDEPTDVLTFAFNEGDAFVSAEETPLLGEVVVSYDTAAEQASAYSHSVAREISFLIVHGLLHLLGYDDREDEERATMLARQAAILADFDQQALPGA